MRKNKSVKLLVIDGIHFIENQDFLSQIEKKQAKEMATGLKAKKDGTTVEAIAELAVPTGDDFFEMDLNPKMSSEM